MKNLEEGWRGMKGSLKRHGKECSKTKRPHEFEKTGERTWILGPLSGHIGSRSVYFRCSKCGKKRVDFSWLPKKE